MPLTDYQYVVYIRTLNEKDEWDWVAIARSTSLDKICKILNLRYHVVKAIYNEESPLCESIRIDDYY